MSQTGVVREAKCVGPACSQCFLKCSVNIPKDQREQIFHKYYNLGSVEKQWEFIACCTGRISTKRRRVSENKMPKLCLRNRNIAYYLEVDDSRIRVCRKFLMNTLVISNTVIRTALKKCNAKGELIMGDRRGGARNKINELKVSVK